MLNKLNKSEKIIFILTKEETSKENYNRIKIKRNDE